MPAFNLWKMTCSKYSFATHDNDYVWYHMVHTVRIEFHVVLIPLLTIVMIAMERQKSSTTTRILFSLRPVTHDTTNRYRTTPIFANSV